MQRVQVCKYSTLRSSDLVCTDLVYETTDIQSKETVLTRYMLGVMEAGGGELRLKTQTYALSEGDVFFIRRDTPFRLLLCEGSCYFYICFQGRRAEELTERLGLTAPAAVIDRRDEHQRLSAFAFECMEKMSEWNTDLFGEAVLLYLMGHLCEQQNGDQKLLCAMLTLTNEHFTENTFGLPNVAQILGYDAKYLSHYFKKAKGIGYAQYLRQLRIDHAVFLMEQGVACVKNIALLSGFSDALYFSKVFKESKGVSPKQYIDSLRSK